MKKTMKKRIAFAMALSLALSTGTVSMAISQRINRGTILTKSHQKIMATMKTITNLPTTKTISKTATEALEKLALKRITKTGANCFTNLLKDDIFYLEKFIIRRFESCLKN